MPSATGTFYPDANVESTSVDGSVIRSVAASTWDSLVTGVGTGHKDDGADWPLVCFFTHSGTVTDRFNNLYRAILLFDTSTIPAGATISTATLSVFFYYKLDGLGILPDLNVYSSNPASNNDLINADYNTLGSTPFCDTSLAYNDIQFNNLTDFELNAAGRAAITPAGVTKLGIRNANYDVANTPPAWSYEVTTLIYALQADYGGALRPKLTVNYRYLDSSTNGFIWVEETKLHYGADSGEREFEGSTTGGTGTAGHLWVEGTYIHYIDSSGNERRQEGTDTTVNATAGHIFVESTKLHYIDANGDERYIEGTTV